MTICQFAMDLENIHGGAMMCGENFGESSDQDGLQRPVTTVMDGDV